MKEKFMNVVNKVRNMDRKTVVKTAVIGVGTVVGMVVANYLINQSQNHEEIPSEYYDVVDVESETIE
jgi:hypothetical protein